MSHGIVVVLLGTVVAPSVLGAVTFLVLRKLDPESLKKRFVPAVTRKPESNVAIAEFAQVGPPDEGSIDSAAALASAMVIKMFDPNASFGTLHNERVNHFQLFSSHSGLLRTQCAEAALSSRGASHRTSMVIQIRQPENEEDGARTAGSTPAEIVN